jgi:hypothetical protein
MIEKHKHSLLNGGRGRVEEAEARLGEKQKTGGETLLVIIDSAAK